MFRGKTDRGLSRCLSRGASRGLSWRLSASRSGSRSGRPSRGASGWLSGGTSRGLSSYAYGFSATNDSVTLFVGDVVDSVFGTISRDVPAMDTAISHNVFANHFQAQQYSCILFETCHYL